jgi:hypothetical protein
MDNDLVVSRQVGTSSRGGVSTGTGTGTGTGRYRTRSGIKVFERSTHCDRLPSTAQTDRKINHSGIEVSKLSTYCLLLTAYTHPWWNLGLGFFIFLLLQHCCNPAGNGQIQLTN